MHVGRACHVQVCATGLPGGTASEMLGVAGVLEKYLCYVVRPSGLCEAEVTSALALIRVAFMLSVVNSPTVTGPALEAAIVAHLRLHQTAYDLDLWRPKCHYCLHLGQQLQRHNMLLATFTQERKHRLIGRCTTPEPNTTFHVNRRRCEPTEAVGMIGCHRLGLVHRSGYSNVWRPPGTTPRRSTRGSWRRPLCSISMI